MWSFDSIKLILTEKQPFNLFNLCHFGQLFHYAWGYAVCVINLFYSLQWIFFKPNRHFLDIMKIRRRSLDGNKIFYRIMAFYA